MSWETTCESAIRRDDPDTIRELTELPHRSRLVRVAVEFNRPECVLALAERGADVDVDGMDNYTPLQIAVMRGYVDVVRALIACGTDVNRCCCRPVALSLAAKHKEKSVEIATCLLKAGADVDRTDRHGQTPLIFCVMHGRPELARMLLAHGANTRAITHYNASAASMAFANGHCDMLRAIHAFDDRRTWRRAVVQTYRMCLLMWHNVDAYNALHTLDCSGTRSEVMWRVAIVPGVGRRFHC